MTRVFRQGWHGLSDDFRRAARTVLLVPVIVLPLASGASLASALQYEWQFPTSEKTELQRETWAGLGLAAAFAGLHYGARRLRKAIPKPAPY